MEPKSNKPNQYVQFEGYWVQRGGLELEIPNEYVLTESVRRNLKDLVRVVAISRLPVLLQVIFTLLQKYVFSKLFNTYSRVTPPLVRPV